MKASLRRPAGRRRSVSPSASAGPSMTPCAGPRPRHPSAAAEFLIPATAAGGGPRGRPSAPARGPRPWTQRLAGGRRWP
eukprot:9466967-Pyramimonas_sp.AAC.1